MDKGEYQKLVNDMSNKYINPYEIFYSFLSGGILMCSIEILNVLLMKIGFSYTTSISLISILLILVTVVLTGTGKFDNLVKKYRFGLIIPTTGFAHSFICSLLDYKDEGAISGLGSNAFKLAGSVIVYGILAAFVCTIIKVIIYG